MLGDRRVVISASVGRYKDTIRDDLRRPSSRVVEGCRGKLGLADRLPSGSFSVPCVPGRGRKSCRGIILLPGQAPWGLCREVIYDLSALTRPDFTHLIFCPDKAVRAISDICLQSPQAPPRSQNIHDPSTHATARLPNPDGSNMSYISSNESSPRNSLSNTPCYLPTKIGSAASATSAGLDVRHSSTTRTTSFSSALLRRHSSDMPSAYVSDEDLYGDDDKPYLSEPPPPPRSAEVWLAKPLLPPVVSTARRRSSSSKKSKKSSTGVSG